MKSHKTVYFLNFYFNILCEINVIYRTKFWFPLGTSLTHELKFYLEYIYTPQIKHEQNSY